MSGLLPCRAHVLLLLVLFLLPVLTGTKRQPNQEKPNKPRQPPTTSQPAKRPRNRSVPGSGELTTKKGDRCIWQTSGEVLVSLLVNCSSDTQGTQPRYWCRYAGKPDLCQAYGVKSSQYWKQLVGKLKKRQNACEGEKILKAKTCKKAPAEAHMKLAQNSTDERKGGKEGGKRKGSTEGRNSDGVKAERMKKEEEKKKKKKLEEKLDENPGSREDGVMMSDMEPVQSYCSEGWNAVCSFFIKLFEG
ncbi:fibroblast growth factor-binding protein 2 [Thalassophryne amazonica]|uniref:fibroblast growth factor-binding protein 2 n=1 Tax=Thalassophryne amazonica TaxID=390379 RepID=UPI001471D365|nr:fibroblast growth factor-binding protein 2 [Thalassophryne amazonica]